MRALPDDRPVARALLLQVVAHPRGARQHRGDARAVAVAPESGDAAGVAAVLARSAGMGDNLKQQCACDGTVIWESSHDDFKPEKKKADGAKSE